MIKSIIVARAENGVIGKNNDLPWHLPADLRYFRQTTMGHFIVMGRKTLESTDKPLPGRTSIVVSRQTDLSVEGCMVVNSLQEAYDLGAKYGQQEIFVLGGGQIYSEAINHVDRIYLTEVHTKPEGDTTFPDIPSDFKEIKRQDFKADEKNSHDYSFVIYQRKK